MSISKKVCLLGSVPVGKTSLIRRFVKGIFSDKYLTTVGVKIDKKVVEAGSHEVTLILWDLAGEDEEPSPRYFVNPEVLDPSEDMSIHEEGCLSVPDYYDEVERPARCRVKYLDYDGHPQILEAEGLLATCIQHEMDHLEGVLFIDHLSRLKRERVLKKLKKEQRLAAAE